MRPGGDWLDHANPATICYVLPSVSLPELPETPSSELSPKYKVLERLAVGGMAELFLAELEGLHGFRKKVVIKKMLPQYATDENFIQMFLDEARLVACLNHASIVQVFDIGQGADGVFFTMEYVDGFTVSNILSLCVKRKRQLEVEEVLSIAIPVAEALEHAHAFCDEEGEPMDLVHRDVSPSNIIVTTKGRVKLLDFGVAKSNSQLSLTVGNSIKGKFGYMAPEQTRGLDIDKRCDIFSFGVVLWEMLTGRRLYPGGVERAVLLKILDEDAPPPSTIRESLPPAIDAICAKALARDPDERYSDLREFLDDVAAFEASLSSARTSRTLSTMIELLFPKGRVSSPLTDAESVRLSLPLVSTSVEPIPDAAEPNLNAVPTSAINKALLVEAGIEASEEVEPVNRKKYLLLAGCLLGAAALLVILLRGDSKPKREVVAQAAVVNADAAGKVVASEPAKPGDFLVRVDVEPVSAQIEIDGALVGTGSYLKSYSEDGSTHTMRVFAKGHEEFRATFQDKAPEQKVVLALLASAVSDTKVDSESKPRRSRRRRNDPSLPNANTSESTATPVAKPPIVKPVRKPKTEVGSTSDNLDPWKN